MESEIASGCKQKSSIRINLFLWVICPTASLTDYPVSWPSYESPPRRRQSIVCKIHAKKLSFPPDSVKASSGD